MIAARPDRSHTVATTDSRDADCADQAVVIATVARPQGDTGVHTHTRTLLDGFSAAGLSCDLVTPFGGSRKWPLVFAVRRAVLSSLNRTWATRWYRCWHGKALYENLLNRLAVHHPSAIIAQCPLSARAALDARQKVNGRFGVVMVCHFNYSEASEYRDKGELRNLRYFQRVLAMEKDVMESADGVIYVSNWSRQVVERDRGIHPRSPRVIWNGLSRDTRPRALSYAEGPALTRGKLGLSADDVILINVGTLEPRKNQLGLVDLFARIATEFPQARLLLVGEGPSRRRIEQRIAALGLQSKIILLGLRRDVSDLLALADIYVHAATLENCPIAILEAARAGLPVAAVPAGGVPELLDALGGLRLDPQDASASLHDLRPLLVDPCARTAFGRRARQNFEQHFTREAMMAEYRRALGRFAVTEGAVRS